ncbi:peptidase M14 [Halalkalibacillus sediminis]|uniref:Peptidase M14 n=1 Tax=Halalkalibacillus sediminis TaxID=2018042 RepID=A0A2I0QXV2_9BACI|nr:M14 family zinc carboxypeptidase [Halalkalibacillus sediminis]PKR79163.1 peptidase M14 [Halalkalibacillus sediminis]
MIKKVISVLLIIVVITLHITDSSVAETSYHIDNPKQTYTYEMMVEDIEKMAKNHPDLITYQSLGKTPYDRDIWAVKLGHGDASIFINGSHHAREWITTNLNMKMIQTYAEAYQNHEQIEEYDVSDVLNRVTIWFVPMVNPDGVALQQKGLDAFPAEVHHELIEMNEGSTDFKRWKANARGVDLNRQYDYEWDNIAVNHEDARWSKHKGKEPFSEKENKIIRQFTNEINAEILISYHSSGRVLYWDYPEKDIRYDDYAKIISGLTGYVLINPEDNPARGTFMRWFVQEFQRPAFTPELSYFVGETHVPVEIFPDIWERNISVPLYAAEQGYTQWSSRVNEHHSTLIYQLFEWIKNILFK